MESWSIRRVERRTWERLAPYIGLGWESTQQSESSLGWHASLGALYMGKARVSFQLPDVPIPKRYVGRIQAEEDNIKTKYINTRGTLFYHLDSHIFLIYWNYKSILQLSPYTGRTIRLADRSVLLRNKDDHQVALARNGPKTLARSAGSRVEGNPLT